MEARALQSRSRYVKKGFEIREKSKTWAISRLQGVIGRLTLCVENKVLFRLRGTDKRIADISTLQATLPLGGEVGAP
jgi:hypothetical protein